MRLYHFTNPANFIRIAAEGLTPNVKPENALMTIGRPVVWLTTNESNEVTEADVAHLSVYAPNERRAVGDFNFGGSHRITVTLSRTSKRLAHWSTWMRKHSRVIVDENGAARQTMLVSCYRRWTRSSQSHDTGLALELVHPFWTHSTPQTRA